MTVFVEISILLIITTIISTVFYLFKQPLIISYIVSGVVLGPYFFNLLHSKSELDLFSKIGISILLFIVGLSLNPSIIKETGKVSLVTGIGQIVFTSFFGFIIFTLLGFNTVESLYASIALTFSSTIIIMKLLSDKGDLNKLYGKISMGFLIVQDLVATVLLILIPIIGTLIVADQISSGQISNLFILLLNGLAVMFLVYIFSKYILPRISFLFAKSQELLFLFSISWGLFLASVFYLIGYSIEIGALVAGVTLASSKFSYEISSRLKPIRDFFIVMFFLLLGSHMTFTNIESQIPIAILLSLFVLIGNPIIVFVLMNLLGYKSKLAFLSGLTVAQISEFSLILMTLGLSLGHVDNELVSLITIVGIITIVGSTYLIIYGDAIYEKLKWVISFFELRKISNKSRRSKKETFDLVIFGFGRVGYEFVKTSEKLDYNTLVVDYNPELIKKLENKKIKYLYGDAEEIDFLNEINFKDVKIVVSTIPSPGTNLGLIKYIRNKNINTHIITIAHKIEEAKELYLEGASYVVMPHYLGAHHAANLIVRADEEAEVLEKARNTHLLKLSESEKFEN